MRTIYRFCLLLVLLPAAWWPQVARAQAVIPVSGYALVASSGTYTALTTTAATLSAGNADDGYYNGLPLGFTFYFRGQPYTTVSASTNGWLTFGQDLSNSTNGNNLTAGGSARRPLVAPLWDDLSLSSGGFYYVTAGTAPNRVFTAEWRQALWDFNATGPTISFQVKLYERVNRVEFVYQPASGTVSTNSGGASIGLSGSTGDFLSLTSTGTAPTASSSTETRGLATKPATGQTYTFSPPRPAYTFAARTGRDAYQEVAGTAATLSGGNPDDGYYNGLPLGFTFTFRGQPCTTVSASTNGWLTFGQDLRNSANDNNLTTGSSAPRPLLAPLWDDLYMGDGGFYYATTGTAPNRIFTAEWRQFRWDYSAAAPAISFQVRLFEGSNRVWFVYRPEAGAVDNGSGGASIGLSDDNGYFLSLNNTGPSPTASSTAETNNLATKPALNQIYAFAPTGTTNGPLPVELTAFTAAAGPAGYGPATVRLAWATASEKNSAAFEVERSADGRTFAPIGTVAAAGSSSSARRYELTDAQLPAGAARPYYRLKQVDADGTFSYSPVRTVGLTDAAEGLSLYPNPARGGAATLTGALPGTVATVFDALGRPVATATADASGTAALALPAGLPAGVYLVRAGSKAVRMTVE